MKSIVVDSSVTVKWLNQVNEKFIDQADELLADAQAGSVSLLAPELSKYEKGSITYYDASFVALAKKESAVLVTDNPKHQSRQLDVKVISLEDY